MSSHYTILFGVCPSFFYKKTNGLQIERIYVDPAAPKHSHRTADGSFEKAQPCTKGMLVKNSSISVVFVTKMIDGKAYAC